MDKKASDVKKMNPTNGADRFDIFIRFVGRAGAATSAQRKTRDCPMDLLQQRRATVLHLLPKGGAKAP